MCDGGYYPLSRGIGGRYIRRPSLFARVPGSRDSSASPPRLVSSPSTPDSLPGLVRLGSRDADGDLDSGFDSPSESFFKSDETRRWVERQEQEAVALWSAGVCSPGSDPASSDASEGSSSSSDRGERGSSLGDGGLEVGVGSGAGEMGSRRPGMSGLCVPPSNDDVELLLAFALSSRAPQPPVLE